MTLKFLILLSMAGLLAGLFRFVAAVMSGENDKNAQHEVPAVSDGELDDPEQSKKGASDYHIEVLRQSAPGLAHLVTCRTEFARGLEAWLNDNDVAASLSAAAPIKHISSDDVGYNVSEIEIDPPANYERVKATVECWPGFTIS